MTELNVNSDGEFAKRLAEDVLDPGHAAAVKFLARRPFLSTTRYRAQQWEAERIGAYEPMLKWLDAVVKRFADLGIPVYARRILVKRSEQEREVVQGRTKVRFGDSPHNFGYAVDLVHSLREEDMPRVCWEIFGHIGQEVAKQQGLDIVWGDKIGQPEHWEMRDWFDWRYDGPPGGPDAS